MTDILNITGYISIFFKINEYYFLYKLLPGQVSVASLPGIAQNSDISPDLFLRPVTPAETQIGYAACISGQGNRHEAVFDVLFSRNILRRAFPGAEEILSQGNLQLIRQSQFHSVSPLYFHLIPSVPGNAYQVLAARMPSISSSSSFVKSGASSAFTFSVTCSGLLAPIRVVVTSGSLRSQRMAICARLCPRR